VTATSDAEKDSPNVPEHTRVITAVLLVAIGIVGPFWGENV